VLVLLYAHHRIPLGSSRYPRFVSSSEGECAADLLQAYTESNEALLKEVLLRQTMSFIHNDVRTAPALARTHLCPTQWSRL
jgi:hypothetical protein